MKIEEEVDPKALLTLSPSRASDFKACPQLFKFRVVDRIPEPPDPWSARGTLVHAALEALFQDEPQTRTLDRAISHLRTLYEDFGRSVEHTLLKLSPEEDAAWLAGAETLLHNYFLIEDPPAVDAQELEWWVQHENERLLMRGIIDRVEVLPSGDWVLTDYKTGRSPSENYTLDAFFGLKFYALLCWKSLGRLPSALRLVHLREPKVITLRPTEAMLEAVERQLNAIGDAITRAFTKDDWRPRPGRLCSWCPHQAICPATAS